MTPKVLNEHHLEFLILKRGLTGWSESTLVKKPDCRKSYVMAQLFMVSCVKSDLLSGTLYPF